MQQTVSANGNGAAGQVRTFEYPVDPHAPLMPISELWSAAGSAVGSDAGVELRGDSGPGAGSVGQSSEMDAWLAEENRKGFEAGRERGRQEGRQMEHEAQAAAQSAAEQRRMRQAAELADSLAQERDLYLRAVEHEVVKLALAVAARILRREAQMDPLLLTGAVRVALGQLSASTQVRLRVPQAELELWTEAIALLPNLAVKPVVVAGEGMRLGDCKIEAELGTVDLGIRAQLGEIERGFFDRAGGRAAEPVVKAEEELSIAGEMRI
jgi:flagellar biosynthesis/type III secretory pathway protein FliH